MNNQKFDEVTVPIKKSTDKLPKIASITGNMLDQLTDALGVDRSVVALDEQIEQAWSQLPRLVRRIPPELRDEQIAKACISVASAFSIRPLTTCGMHPLSHYVTRFGDLVFK